LCRVEWETICGKMIQLLEFIFGFLSEVLLYVPSGMSNFEFGPRFLYEILSRNDSLVNWNEIKDFFMSHVS
jgi:hypothetical protein